MEIKGGPASSIGVFDSGVGGLSILHELKELMPNESYVFFADQRHVPYGQKTKSELVALTSTIMEFFKAREVKMVVAACNTATCYAIDDLRSKFEIPIVGVVPAIKPAAEQTKTGEIALLATPATAASPYVSKLIETFAANIRVRRIGCDGLEDRLEQGDLEGKITGELLDKYVRPLKETKVDQVVLGCTHYPFLKEQIASILGPGVSVIDSGQAVAKRAAAVLEERSLKNTETALADRFFTNKSVAEFSRVASKLLGRSIAAQYSE
ncbi:MAG TPA: glutamate racemase [Candidatus Paceibacterota bacterium]|nr:glutamate racemase [Candidatus Paceibacterota bacterium]